MKHIVQLVLMIGVPAMVSAQDSDPFLGLDLAGGWVSGGPVPGSPTNEDGSIPAFNGWGVDGNFRFLRPWLGVAGTFSRTSGADYTLSSIAAGPRLTSPYFKSGFRGFVHGLTGVATLNSPDGSADRSPTFTAGGGFDIGIFGRVQIDYVRRDLPGVDKNEVRATIGAVLPLCLRPCRDYAIDGLNVGARR